jgi:hypothetical protein
MKLKTIASRVHDSDFSQDTHSAESDARASESRAARVPACITKENSATEMLAEESRAPIQPTHAP